MGTKFGNIHVKTNNLEEVISAIKELISDTSYDHTDNSNDSSGMGSLMHKIAMSRKIYYIGAIQPDWVSILNDWFGWGEVEAFAEDLSSYLPFPILTCSYFDDDVLQINVFHNGEYTTGQIWCSDYVREDYDLENKEMDISLLAELLGHEYIERITNVLINDDLEQVVQEFESILELPLWIHSDWFSHMEKENDEIVSKYVTYDFNS